MGEPERGEERRSWWEGGPDRPGSHAAAADAHDPYRAQDQQHGDDPHRGDTPYRGYDQDATRAVPQAGPGAAGDATAGSPWSAPGSWPDHPPLATPGGQQPPVDGRPQEQPHAQGYGQPYAQSYGQPYNQVHGQPADPHGQPPVAGSAHAVLWTAVGGAVLLFSGLGWIAAIVALALAPGARRDVLASQGARRGLGHVLAGKIVAWVTLALSLLFVVGLVAFIAWLNGQGPAYYDGYDYTDSISTPVRL
ncbi:chromosomal replication initiator protein DnaA [Kineococcus sp. SYSU DK018]|uniref:hypothetical protein n=1 Tax=Kineococcus sp. SYSU DK018 TaxID=3383139 RepID=UPI003D7E8C3C